MTRRKPYVRSMDRWWLRNSFFTRYMIREATSVFLGLYTIVLLIGLVALSLGEASYERWLATMAHPAFIGFHIVVLAAACYHTYTWFGVSPKAMPSVRIGNAPLTPALIIRGQYLALAIITLVVLVAVASGET